MSTGYECAFLRVRGQFYYVLQRWDCPVGAWDWREYADCYGPFATEEQAENHLDRHHANPGGWSCPQEDGEGNVIDTEPDEVLAKLIASARK